MNRFSLTVVLCTAGILPASLVGAQTDWPTKAIKVIVASPAGGGVDTIARLIGDPAAEALGQPIVIDPKPGGGGSLGPTIAAKAPPDGYTFFLGTASSHGVAPSFYKSPPYDAIADFVAVARVVEAPPVMIASSKQPARSIQQLVALAKSNPGKLNYGSNGTGTLNHLAGVLFAVTAGIEVVHVPYKAVADQQQSMLRGDIQFGFFNSNRFAAAEAVTLAVASPQRVSWLPGVPTFAEVGLKDVVLTQWYGYFAPARTPQPIVSRFAAEIAKSLARGDVAEKLRNGFYEPAFLGPRDFDAFYKAEIKRFAPIVKASGASGD